MSHIVEFDPLLNIIRQILDIRLIILWKNDLFNLFSFGHHYFFFDTMSPQYISIECNFPCHCYFAFNLGLKSQ